MTLDKITQKLRKAGKPFAIITVEGGVADIEESYGTEVVIWDYDNEKAGESQ